MKVFIVKALALGGLCALFAGIGNVAGAQGVDHHHQVARVAHHKIKKMQRVYAHAVHNGNTAAARRAHARAMAIRARARAHRLHHG
ncbi:MAG: hypothetical protein JWN14_4507 [Chthonomonadales bacterium]|nr:hypothetical protein [Chthonomonadales bacterium]